MQSLTLSEAAVAIFGLRAKGLRVPATARRLAAYRELSDAGIMEPDGDGFRFTEAAWSRREELLREAVDSIERDRYEPPDASGLSDSARELLERIASGDRIEITPGNLSAFRELAAARIILLCSSVAGGPESVYRWTYWGWHQRFELSACAKEAV
jgi:hypothetical protein